MAFHNQLLDRLPAPVAEAFAESATLSSHDLYYRIDDDGLLPTVAFPVDSVISLLTKTLDGHAVELATVGSEGFVSIQVALGADRFPRGEYAQIQVPGALWTVESQFFRAMMVDHPAFASIVFRYAQAYQAQLAQQVACNALHAVDQRVARWLLVTADRARSAEFPLTQEFLSEMLGVRRATVNTVARNLQAAGVIEYARGRLRILDRSALEERTCSCYRDMNERVAEIFGREA